MFDDETNNETLRGDLLGDSWVYTETDRSVKTSASRTYTLSSNGNIYKHTSQWSAEYLSVIVTRRAR
jgi:hypothetical protein